MVKSALVNVRLERQPNRRAVERLREAYGRLQQAGQRVVGEGQWSVQEVGDEYDSGPVRASIHSATRAGSHNRESGRSG